MGNIHIVQWKSELCSYVKTYECFAEMILFTSAVFAVIFLSGNIFSCSTMKLIYKLQIFWGGLGQYDQTSKPLLQILPSGSQEIRAGKNLVLTCRAQVSRLELVEYLTWIDPQGQEISRNDR